MLKWLFGFVVFDVIWIAIGALIVGFVVSLLGYPFDRGFALGVVFGIVAAVLLLRQALALRSLGL
jgi:hypothetical protein